MILNALILAIATTVGWYMLYSHLPRRVRRFLEAHGIIIDIIALIATYLLLGGTATALMAAAFCDIIISLLLWVARNPDDFIYLYDLKDWLKEQLNTVKEQMTAYGATYREQKEQQARDATLLHVRTV